MKLKRPSLPDIKGLSRRMFASKNGILGVIIVVATGMVSIAVLSAPEPDKKAVVETSWPVTVLPAKVSENTPELNLFGRVETPRESMLTAALVSHVAEVHVLEGSLVATGDLLVQLDPTDAALMVQRREADLVEAKANLASLQLKAADDRAVLTHEHSLFELVAAKMKRYDQLRSQKSISEEVLNAVEAESDRQAIALRRQQGQVADAGNQLARAEAQVSRAEVSLGEAKVMLSRTTITAPFDGRVTSVRVSAGELVQPGAPIVSMYDTTNMVVRAQIPTAALPEVKQRLESGHALMAYIDTTGEPIVAPLTRLSGEVTEGRSSIDGLFDVDSASALEVGRSVSIRLSMPAVQDTVLLPLQSLYGHNRVFAVVGDRLKAITVERLGEKTDKNGRLCVLVRSAEITPQLPIVTSQLSIAVTGLKVRSGEVSLPQAESQSASQLAAMD